MFVLSCDLVVQAGAGRSRWMTVPIHMAEEVKKDPAEQRLLLRQGNDLLTLKDIQWGWREPEQVLYVYVYTYI